MSSNNLKKKSPFKKGGIFIDSGDFPPFVKGGVRGDLLFLAGKVTGPTVLLLHRFLVLCP
jgi:hypothetical protein